MSILDPIEHARLLADLDHIASVAGVQQKFIKTSMKEYCGKQEMEWVMNYNKYKAEGMPGLVLEGLSDPDSRCQAIAGALIRNFIDARVIPLNTLLDAQSRQEAPNPTVLLVPNLFIKLADKGIPAWKMQGMYDLILDRVVHNKSSVLYVQDQDELEKSYGEPFKDLLNKFRWVSV